MLIVSQQVNDSRFMFDARMGFVLKNPAVTDSGLYNCYTNNQRIDSWTRATALTITRESSDAVLLRTFIFLQPKMYI
jgi:hypothetical protein